jgi:hypothetical protein
MKSAAFSVIVVTMGAFTFAASGGTGGHGSPIIGGHECGWISKDDCDAECGGADRTDGCQSGDLGGEKCKCKAPSECPGGKSKTWYCTSNNAMTCNPNQLPPGCGACVGACL